MKKDQATILIVSPTGREVKSLGIKLSHLRIAFFTVIGFAVICFTSFVSTYIIYKKATQKRELSKQLIAQVDVLSQSLNESEAVKGQLEEKIMDIEGKLLEMQELLAKKGIKRELSVGGDFLPQDRLNLSYIGFMEDDLEDLFDAVKSFPLGSPLSGEINSGYGYRKDPFNSRSAFHSGIDIDADSGELVVATADGLVDHAGWKSGYGRTVIIKHQEGYETLYGHLSGIKVKEGQEVKAGDKVGYAGSTGRSTGPHLHYEVIKNGKNLNPMKYLYLR